MREVAPCPAARGSREVGFTQPRAHSFAQLRRYYNGAAAMESKDGNGGFRNGGVGNGYVSWVVGRLPAPVAARINLAMMKGRSISAAGK